MLPIFGELWPTNGWDLVVNIHTINCLGQRVHSCTERESTNFATFRKWARFENARPDFVDSLPLKHGAKNCLFASDFVTTTPLKREYLPNETRHIDEREIFFNCECSCTFPRNLMYFGPQTANTNCMHGVWLAGTAIRLQLPRVAIIMPDKSLKIIHLWHSSCRSKTHKWLQQGRKFPRRKRERGDREDTILIVPCLYQQLACHNVHAISTTFCTCWSQTRSRMRWCCTWLILEALKLLSDVSLLLLTVCPLAKWC